ncbi:MAG: putative baseplate assembly protein, partial [Thermoanaerobaculia bacterium]
DWRVGFENLPGIVPSAVSGFRGPWLHGRLETGLARGESGEVVQGTQGPEMRRRGARPAAAFVQSSGGVYAPVDLDAPFFPFGEEEPAGIFHLSAGADFAKPQSSIEVEIVLDAVHPPASTGNPAVTWEYGSNGTWKTLAVTPAPATAGRFLAGGTLRFDRPEDWTSDPVNGVSGYWLRARVTAGSYGVSPGYRPPRVERLTLGDDWRLPRIDSVQASIEIDRRDPSLQQVPERGYANQTLLDLSKDFLPFGDKPKVGDAFYFASEEAFSKPIASLYLNIVMTDPATVPQPDSATVMLTWEFWDGRAWRFLGNSGPGATGPDTAGNTPGFNDFTEGLRKTGDVQFAVTAPPHKVEPGEVNGETRRWVRARLAKGSYGTTTGTATVYKPPSLASARLGYRYGSNGLVAPIVLTENDGVFADVSIPAAGAGDFMPFVPTADRRSTLYLGFERPGDAVGFANRATSLFFQASEAVYDPGIEQREVTEEASVVWEYWNGEAWERLGTRDETRGFMRRGLVTFVGPADFRSSTELGRTAFWLRGRWERGEYAVEPRLVRVLTNTTWGVHARTVLDEALGSSRGERGQVFRTLRAPVLDGQRLEVIEPEVPPGGDLAELEAEEGDDAVTVVRDAQGQFVEVRVRWHEVTDFYSSGPRSRHYVLDHGTGEVGFGDGRRGLVPPPGRNNVRMARYQAGGGLAGNRPAGRIAQLKGTVPYVDGVVQHVAAEGGAPEESLDAVRARGPKALRHRNRATAAADYEDLAFQASPQVARARALPARKDSDAGQVGLIVVPAAAPGETAKPVPSLELLSRVRSFIEARLSPVVDFWVVGPDWLQMDVRAEVVPLQLETVADVHTAVLERLRAFLHPLSGGPDGEGWDFGRKPQRSDLYTLIEETPGVDHVRRLEVIETPREGGARPGRFLVFSGDHEIALAGNTDDIANGSLS